MINVEPSGNKTCTDDELRLIAVRVAESLRKHPEVNGGVSVRATLSFLEVLEALGRIDGSISLDAVYDSAFSTFGGRLRSKGWRNPDEILQ
jgi:hypothetical protein